MWQRKQITILHMCKSPVKQGFQNNVHRDTLILLLHVWNVIINKAVFAIVYTCTMVVTF